MEKEPQINNDYYLVQLKARSYKGLNRDFIAKLGCVEAKGLKRYGKDGYLLFKTFEFFRDLIEKTRKILFEVAYSLETFCTYNPVRREVSDPITEFHKQYLVFQDVIDIIDDFRFGVIEFNHVTIEAFLDNLEDAFWALNAVEDEIGSMWANYVVTQAKNKRVFIGMRYKHIKYIDKRYMYIIDIRLEFWNYRNAYLDLVEELKKIW